VKRYINILACQGLLLFGIAIFHLRDLDAFHLAFILLETLCVKAIIIPWFLKRLLKRNDFDRLSQSKVPDFASVMVISLAIVFGFVLDQNMHEGNLHSGLFAVAIACIITGIYFVMTHLNIFTHLIGYLVMENGIFLLSLSVGSEMPMMVSLAILLDVFVGVLVLGVFINRVGNTFKEMDIDRLTQLKD